jgi:SpoVK/Ycf46/Vps4 family AAA+-type ATPase
VQEEKDMAPAIFVFKDFHLFLQDKDVLRMIRDIKENYGYPNYCPIVVTSPLLELPPELEKIFTYYEFPLMDKEEITEKFTTTLTNLRIEQSVIDSVIESSVGLTSREIERALYHSLAKNIVSQNKKTVTPQDIHEEKIQIIKKSGALDFIRPEHTLDDLGGCDNFKLWIKKVKEAMTPEAEAFGIPKPKGAMLVGVPGTSKTVSAEILASYLNIPLLSLDMAKVMGSFVGQSERQIANALRITKSVAPCILVLDEMEKILGGVQSSNSTDSGTLSRVMSQLLNFLQQDNTNVITIMTSNDVSQLPPELTRSGRIDAQWMFDLPNEFERGEIIEIYLKKNKLETDSNTFTYFTTATENFTGAEIKSAVKDAMINSFYRQKANSVENFTRSLTIEDIKSAIDNTVTVWKSNHEKIEAFRTYSKSRYLNASKTLDEIKAESKAKKISNNIKVPKESSNVINIVFGSDK